MYAAGDDRSNEAAREPLWTYAPVVRAVDDTRLGQVLADIDSRLPATGLTSSATYRDSDLGTWAHEATHGVNSLMRNEHGAGTGVENALYCLNGRTALIEEPRPCTIRDAARYVPTGLRSRMYAQYMIGRTRQWNQIPLYILDEWVAYLNGATHNVWMAKNGGSIGDGAGDLLFTAESAINALAIVCHVQQEIQAGRVSYNDTQLRHAFAFNWSRMMTLFAEAKPVSQLFMDPIAYYRKFSEGRDGDALRRWCRTHLGAAWSSEVMWLVAT